MTPTLSVITATLDCDANIYKTLDSLGKQLDSRTEWVIKNSNENITTNFESLNAIENVNLVAKKDFGIYEGLNQAVEVCRGRSIIVVGAGDEFFPGAIDMIHEALLAFPDTEAFFFPVYLLHRDRMLYPEPMEMNSRMATPHPGCVLNKDIILKLGGFDLSYKIASDYDLVSRFLNLHPKFQVGDVPIIKFLGGGLSDNRGLEGYLEEELIRLRTWKTPVLSLGERLRIKAQSIESKYKQLP